jgi:threonyl-tRNA synthetase
MFIVGAKEAEKNAVSVRRHGEGDLGVLSIDEAIQKFQLEIASKGLSDDGSEVN